MLLIAYGSQVVSSKVRAIAKYSARLQQFFGILIILLAVAIYFQLDIQIENKLANFFPVSAVENQITTQIVPGTEFTGIDHWLRLRPAHH